MDGNGAHFPLLSRHHGSRWKLRSTFSTSAAGLLLALILACTFLVQYSNEAASDRHVNQYYMWYIHVAVMIFVGFGFLMTFLKSYSYSAVGLNFFASCIVMLAYIVVGGLLKQVAFGKAKKIELDIPLLIDAAFCAAAAMISFGAILGKCSPTQLLWLLILEVPVYAVNQQLVFQTFKALDIGGSMSIHAFGAYYGLAASFWLSSAGAGASHPKNKASYSSDMTAMIGTIFLWIFWPSFNGALASNPDPDMQGSLLALAGDAASNSVLQFQFYCVVNTVLALLAACVAAFALSSALLDKFDMVHIQNATLAGGVAIGSSANLLVGPAGALTVGALAGCLSVLGYYKVTPWVEAKLSLKDTCGVHNLHGMPGILGGLTALVVSLVKYSANAPILSKGHLQYAFQLAGLSTSLGIALFSGTVFGMLVSYMDPYKQTLTDDLLFEDAMFWTEVEHESEA